MRITTRMLNESARKAGLPINRASLLNSINSDGNSNALLEALNRKKTAINAESKANYEKLWKESDTLMRSAEMLSQKGENSLFAQAEASGDNQKVYDGVASLFKNYNATMKALENTGGILNDFYRQMLSEAPEEIGTDLESIGITFGKDGAASVDMEKVKTADLAVLEDLFGSGSDFADKLRFIATRVSENAEANAESFGNGYTSDGNPYTGDIVRKYDFWG